MLVGNGPRRGYWHARVVPGGETGVFVGFSLHVCGNGLWESTSVCVCVCFITAGPITKLCAWGEEESGGHVL